MTGAQARRARSHPLPTLAEAIAAREGVVSLEADWGGQALAVARGAAIACGKAALGQLLYDLAELACPEDELQGIRLSFHYAPAGTRLPGGIACRCPGRLLAASRATAGRAPGDGARSDRGRA